VEPGWTGKQQIQNGNTLLSHYQGKKKKKDYAKKKAVVLRYID